MRVVALHQPNPDTVELLRDLLRLAESGVLLAFSMLYRLISAASSCWNSDIDEGLGKGMVEFSRSWAYKNDQAARRLGRLARGLGDEGHRAVRRFYLGRLNIV